jgi:hypothetical protein
MPQRQARLMSFEDQLRYRLSLMTAGSLAQANFDSRSGPQWLQEARVAASLDKCADEIEARAQRGSEPEEAMPSADQSTSVAASSGRRIVLQRALERIERITDDPSSCRALRLRLQETRPNRARHEERSTSSPLDSGLSVAETRRLKAKELAHRVDGVSERIKEVRLREMERLRQEYVTQRDKHAKRVQDAAERQISRKRAKRWMALLVHAEFLEGTRRLVIAARLHRQELLRMRMAVLRISATWKRNAARFREQVRRRDMERRRRNSADLIARFARDHSNITCGLSVVMKRYRHRVVNVQRMWRSFVAITRARMELVGRIFDRVVEEEYVELLEVCAREFETDRKFARQVTMADIARAHAMDTERLFHQRKAVSRWASVRAAVITMTRLTAWRRNLLLQSDEQAIDIARPKRKSIADELNETPQEMAARLDAGRRRASVRLSNTPIGLTASKRRRDSVTMKTSANAVTYLNVLARPEASHGPASKPAGRHPPLLGATHAPTPPQSLPPDGMRSGQSPMLRRLYRFRGRVTTHADSAPLAAAASHKPFSQNTPPRASTLVPAPPPRRRPNKPAPPPRRPLLPAANPTVAPSSSSASKPTVNPLGEEPGLAPIVAPAEEDPPDQVGSVVPHQQGRRRRLSVGFADDVAAAARLRSEAPLQHCELKESEAEPPKTPVKRFQWARGLHDFPIDDERPRQRVRSLSMGHTDQWAVRGSSLVRKLQVGDFSQVPVLQLSEVVSTDSDMHVLQVRKSTRDLVSKYLSGERLDHPTLFGAGMEQWRKHLSELDPSQSSVATSKAPRVVVRVDGSASPNSALADTPMDRTFGKEWEPAAEEELREAQEGGLPMTVRRRSRVSRGVTSSESSSEASTEGEVYVGSYVGKDVLGRAMQLVAQQDADDESDDEDVDDEAAEVYDATSPVALTEDGVHQEKESEGGERPPAAAPALPPPVRDVSPPRTAGDTMKPPLHVNPTAPLRDASPPRTAGDTMKPPLHVNPTAPLRDASPSRRRGRTDVPGSIASWTSPLSSVARAASLPWSGQVSARSLVYALTTHSFVQQRKPTPEAFAEKAESPQRGGEVLLSTPLVKVQRARRRSAGRELTKDMGRFLVSQSGENPLLQTRVNKAIDLARARIRDSGSVNSAEELDVPQDEAGDVNPPQTPREGKRKPKRLSATQEFLIEAGVLSDSEEEEQAAEQRRTTSHPLVMPARRSSITLTQREPVPANGEDSPPPSPQHEAPSPREASPRRSSIFLIMDEAEHLERKKRVAYSIDPNVADQVFEKIEQHQLRHWRKTGVSGLVRTALGALDQAFEEADLLGIDKAEIFPPFPPLRLHRSRMGVGRPEAPAQLAAQRRLEEAALRAATQLGPRRIPHPMNLPVEYRPARPSRKLREAFLHAFVMFRRWEHKAEALPRWRGTEQERQADMMRVTAEEISKVMTAGPQAIADLATKKFRDALASQGKPPPMLLGIGDIRSFKERIRPLVLRSLELGQLVRFLEAQEKRRIALLRRSSLVSAATRLSAALTGEEFVEPDPDE